MTLAYVFSEDARLAAELVTTATAVADVVHLVCLGTPPAVPPTGVASVVVLQPAEGVSSPSADGVRPEAYTAALARLVDERGADVVLVGATVSGWEIAARVAAILGLGLVSEATALRSLPDGAWRSERVRYAGGAVQSETWQGPAIVTVTPGGPPDTTIAPDQDTDRTPADAQGTGAVPAETVAVPTETVAVPTETVAVPIDTRIRVVSRSTREIEGVDLTNAARIVCVGMGVGTGDDLALATELADALGAELACTRPVAEDRQWLPAERYIGISGAKVRPDLYLGLGVSGQVQHTFGIRDAKVVVGVNTNPDAALFKVCDYAVVADLREIAPLLAAAVRATRSAGSDPRS